MSNYIVSFNKELIKLVKYLNSIINNEENNNLIKNIQKDINNTKYIDNFWNNIEKKCKLLSEHDEFLFCKDIFILNGDYNLSFYEYYNHKDMDSNNKKKLWEYLEFMYLYTYSYKTI